MQGSVEGKGKEGGFYCEMDASFNGLEREKARLQEQEDAQKSERRH